MREKVGFIDTGMGEGIAKTGGMGDGSRAGVEDIQGTGDLIQGTGDI